MVTPDTLRKRKPQSSQKFHKENWERDSLKESSWHYSQFWVSRLLPHVLGYTHSGSIREKTVDRLELFPQSQADSSAKGRSLNSTKGLGTTSDQTFKINYKPSDPGQLPEARLMNKS